MLHIRYDWRRPMCWAALCTTFFLSSQNSPGLKDVALQSGKINESDKEDLVAVDKAGSKPAQTFVSTVYMLSATR